MSHTRHQARRAGFTLVELLVVITIIGVLVGLLTVGIMAAYNASKRFVLSNEVTQVSASIEQFKSKYGCYPPDMTDVSDPTINNGGVTPANLSNFKAFSAFINKAYPRADRVAIAAFCNTVRNNGAAMDPAEALVFFLARTSKDPRYPLGRIVSGNYQAPQDNEVDVFFEFPAGSLFDADGDSLFEFQQSTARRAPLVYFDARTYTQPVVMSGTVQVGFQNSGYLNTAGIATPYASGFSPPSNYVFFNPKSYQLVCAGTDGEFGVMLTPGTPAYPVLSQTAAIQLPRVPESDGDNVANFTEGTNINSFTAQ
jgi:prepilin-type N-terminal cleavage/methylation domain-containing protein